MTLQPLLPPQRRRSYGPLLCFVALCVLGGCGKQPENPVTAIEGSLRIQPETTLNAPARIELQLLDVTGNDGAASEIAHATAQADTLPYRYSLPFDAGRIDTSHRYTVAARLYVDNSLRFATDSAYPVLSHGYGKFSDLVLNATGGNAGGATVPASTQNDVVHRGELRSGNDISIWSAGFRQQMLSWIEEDRGTGKGLLHARYEFKGGYVLNYSDSSPLDIRFDDHGKPVAVTRSGKGVAVKDAMEQINAVRNRASMLRSDVLAVSEAREHRAATDLAAAPAGAMQLKP